MKRGWLAVALLALLAGVSVWHTLSVDALTAELTDTLERAEAEAETGAWDEALRSTQQARARWDGAGVHLHITLDHAVMDEVSVGFAETLEFLEQREAGEYSAANARLIERIRLLGEMERPVPENLL